MNYGLITPDTFRFCKTCNGSGWGEHDLCAVCEGWGWVAITIREWTRAVAECYINDLKFARTSDTQYAQQFEPNLTPMR